MSISITFPFPVLSLFILFPQEGPVVTKTINFATAASKPYQTPKLSPYD